MSTTNYGAKGRLLRKARRRWRRSGRNCWRWKILSLEAQWKKLLAVENIVLHIDPEYTRPAIESLLGMFENQLRGYHNSLQFKWWTNAGDRKKVVTEHVDRGAPTA